MATQDQIKNALLTEHFRYTPLTLTEDIVNVVNEVVYQAINDVETALKSTPPPLLGFQSSGDEQDGTSGEEVARREADAEIDGGIVKLESLLNSTVDKTFDKLEIYALRNLLTVSNIKEEEGLENWIVLDHYKNVQPTEATNKTDQPSPEAVDSLRRKVEETEKLRSALVAEHARQEALLAKIRPLVSLSSTKPQQGPFNPDAMDTSHGGPDASFSFLTASPGAASLGLGASSRVPIPAGTTPTGQLALNTRFTYSQLQALRSLVQELAPHLRTLPQTEIANSEEAAKRHAYIESQSRKAMQRVGVDPDASAGASIAEMGRRPGTDEVKAMESIVKELGDKMEE